MTFKGFSSVDEKSIPVPEVFFTDLLPEIESAGELRISLYIFWALSLQPAEPRFVRLSDTRKDTRLMAALGADGDEQTHALQAALESACQRGTLVAAQLEEDVFYFLNSERGRAACQGLMDGKWDADRQEHVSGGMLVPERPNIFGLYEQNIGPLTPMIVDTLKEAEQTYPADWISDALRIAVVKNVRNWRYVEAILKDWKEKGRDGADRRSAKEGRKRDSEGEYADYVQH